MSLRDQILSHDDLPSRAVRVPEWGGVAVHVHTLTGAERDQYETEITAQTQPGQDAKTNLRGLKAKLLIRTVRDDQGQPVFGPEDVDLINAKSARAVARLFNVAAELNGLTKDDVEELAGNSEPDPSDASTSGLPSDSE